MYYKTKFIKLQMCIVFIAMEARKNAEGESLESIIYIYKVAKELN